MDKAAFGALVLALAFVAPACVSESRPTGTGEIRFRDPSERFVTLDVHEVLRDGARIGTLQYVRDLDDDFDDANDRHLWFVRDRANDRLGFVTDDGQAFRYRAHTRSAERVAGAVDLRSNVMAVYGYFDGDLVIRPIDPDAPAPATVTELDDVTGEDPDEEPDEDLDDEDADG